MFIGMNAPTMITLVVFALILGVVLYKIINAKSGCGCSQDCSCGCTAKSNCSQDEKNK